MPTPNLAPTTTQPPMQQPASVGMHSAGKNRSRGLRSLQDIKDRCQIDGDCWLWMGAMTGSRMPFFWVVSAGKTMSGGRGLFTLLNGREPPKGLVYYRTCGQGTCLNPEHRKLGTRKQMAKLHPNKASATTVVKQTIKRRARSQMTWECVNAIRAEPTNVEAARKHGVTRQHASQIRRYKIWRPTWLDQIA